MTDREKVIKGLECCLAVTKCGICPYNAGDDMWCGNNNLLLEDALALLKAQEQKCRECGEATSKAIQELQTKLKAQEPVKPTRYQEGRWFKTWRCGACGGTLVFRNGSDKPKYCTDCGRAVRWE